MTKKQRAAVVELLRCAADNRDSTTIFGIFDAAEELLGSTERHGVIAQLAYRASRDLDICGDSFDDESYRAELLEAALRVEQGEWP